MGKGLKDFYNIMSSSAQTSGTHSDFELVSPYRFVVAFEFTKPVKSAITNLDLWPDDKLSLAVRSVAIPTIASPEEAPAVVTHSGFLSLPDPSRNFTESNKLTLTIMNSENTPHEKLFLNWIRETRSHTWVYDDYPFTKANITVNAYYNRTQDFENSESTVMTKYKFVDAFPSSIETIDFSHELVTQLGRTVDFKFNYMIVNDKAADKVNYVDTSKI
jgi:hypothetical protein